MIYIFIQLCTNVQGKLSGLQKGPFPFVLRCRLNDQSAFDSRLLSHEKSLQKFYKTKMSLFSDSLTAIFTHLFLGNLQFCHNIGHFILKVGKFGTISGCVIN